MIVSEDHPDYPESRYVALSDVYASYSMLPRWAISDCLRNFCFW